MKPMRVYMDTAVFGGYFDDEFRDETRRFFQALSEGKMTGLLSETLIAELSEAPEQVRGLLRSAMLLPYEPIAVTEEAVRLSRAYVQAGIVGERYADDALHVALATLARADVLVSWNFKHLVNPIREREFNGVNIAWGYGLIAIASPADIVKTLEFSDEE